MLTSAMVKEFVGQIYKALFMLRKMYYRYETWSRHGCER